MIKVEGELKSEPGIENQTKCEKLYKLASLTMLQMRIASNFGYMNIVQLLKAAGATQ